MKKLLLTCMIALGVTASAQISINEGFEGTAIPSGWAYSRFARTTTASYPCTGIAALRVNLYNSSATNVTGNAVYTSTASNAYEIGVSLKYSVKPFSATTTSNGNLRIEYSVDGGTTYNLLGSQIDFTAATTCTPVSATIPAGTVPVGANFKFRILGNAIGAVGTGYTNDFYLTVDDVKITQLASCNAPEGITISGITDAAATVSWNASSPVPGLGYDLYYSTTATAPTATTTPNFTGITGLSQNLTGLTGDTTYNVWLRSACSSSDKSIWSPVSTFKTSCGSATLPYTQNFETATAPAMPSCTSVQNAGTGNNWATYTLSAATFGFTAGKTLRYTYNATNAANSWFYTPSFNLTAGTTYQLRYRVGSSDVGYAEKMKVALGSTATNTSMTTILADNTSITQGGSTIETVYFTPTTTGVYFLGFNAYSDANMAFLYLDDITLEVAPTCLIPGNPTSSAVTETSATITWAAPSTVPASYDVYYNTTGVAPTASTAPSFANVTGNSQALTGLTAGTNYFVWVRSVCSATDKSPWSSEKLFGTLCPAANYNVPYTQDFESAITPNLPLCTTRSSTSGNNWITVKDVLAGYTGKSLVYPYSNSVAANSWFYTQGINLVAGTEYKITYKYGAMSATFPEKMKVAYGTTATAAGMVTILNDYPNVANTAPATGSATFTPSASGVYYFGFNAYSAAGMYNLIVDDISIVTTASLATNNETKASVSVYPNPFKDVLNISDVKGLKSISVSDISGRTVKNSKATSSLDLSELKTGLYIVTLHYEEGTVRLFKAIKK